MQDQTPSRTALATAYLRAAHQWLDDKPLLLNDPSALPLLGTHAAETIHGALGCYQSPEGKALRAHVVLRSRFTEDRLERATAKGITSYVLIGAGFDTFALRQPSWARALKVVEVDHPATQVAKRERIAKAGLPEPENVIFAPIDFEREGLGEALGRCRLDPGSPAFLAGRYRVSARSRDRRYFAGGSGVCPGQRSGPDLPAALRSRTLKTGGKNFRTG